METRSGALFFRDENHRMEVSMKLIDQGVTYRKVEQMTGIKRTRLGEAIQRRKEGKPITVPMGPKPIVSDELIQKITRVAQDRDLRQDSFDDETLKKYVNDCRQTDIKEGVYTGNNNPKDISDYVFQHVRAQCCPDQVTVPTTQTKRRQAAKCDPGNMLSLMAVWPVVISGGVKERLVSGKDLVDPSCMFNLDTTSLFVGQDATVKICLAKGSKEILRENNQMAGKQTGSAETQQRRSVQLVVLTSAFGELCYTLVKIMDHKVDRIKTFELSDSSTLLIYPTGADSERLTKLIMKPFLSWMTTRAKKILNEKKTLLVNHGTNSTEQSQEIPHEVAAVPVPAGIDSDESVPMIFTLDGEYEQLQHILNNIVPEYPHIQFVKFAAACSNTQQPNDMMRSFSCMKKTEITCRLSQYNDPPGFWYDSVEKELVKAEIFETASRNTLLKFLCNLRTILRKSYTEDMVRAGWRDTGLYPLSRARMLGHWPDKRHLTNKETQLFLGGSEMLFDTVLEHGRVPEVTLKAYLTEILKNSTELVYEPAQTPQVHSSLNGESSSSSCVPAQLTVDEEEDEPAPKKPGKKKALDEMVLNRQRCLWLNNERVLEQHRAQEKVRAAAKAKKEEKKLQQAAAGAAAKKRGRPPKRK